MFVLQVLLDPGLVVRLVRAVRTREEEHSDIFGVADEVLLEEALVLTVEKARWALEPRRALFVHVVFVHVVFVHVVAEVLDVVGVVGALDTLVGESRCSTYIHAI